MSIMSKQESQVDNEHKIDRTGWEAGPWDQEPDKLVWKTEAGLPGMVLRGHHGALCGYVAVSESHPDFKKHYDSVEVQVHGGLTYGNTCAGVICHVPEPGEPDNVYWLGFDCAHFGDGIPGHTRLGDHRSSDTYRDVAYVKRQVESLAKQLAERAQSGSPT